MVAPVAPLLSLPPPGGVRAHGKRPPSFSLSEHVSVPDDQVAIGTVTEFVELAILTMDDTHGTDFHGWVRDEDMVPGICECLGPLIAEYEDGPPHVISRWVTWITQEWRASSVAELLIKLFYHWGIDQQRFADLTRHVIQNRPLASFTSELVANLVVGERARHAAAFVRRLTEPWPSSNDVTELVGEVCRRLKWEPRYFRRFVVHFAKLGKGRRERTAAAILRKPFAAKPPPPADGGPSESGKRRLHRTEIEFCASAFEACVREAKEGLHHQAEETSHERTPASETPAAGGSSSRPRKGTAEGTAENREAEGGSSLPHPPPPPPTGLPDRRRPRPAPVRVEGVASPSPLDDDSSASQRAPDSSATLFRPRTPPTPAASAAAVRRASAHGTGARSSA